MKFNELTQVVLLGTERHAPAAPAAQSPLAGLQAQLDWTQREQSLLLAAALSSLHERGGRLPARDSAPMLAPCAGESLARASDRAGALLLRLVGGEYAELLDEWLELAREASQLAPPEALPQLLAAGATKPEWREAILPALGERGRWLAGLNPDWSWVSGATAEDENIWHTGERPARLLFLQRLRRADSAKALELLTGTWKEEAPEDRTSFLGLLEIGLSASDEPFLETALDDRRKDVRRTAASLLGSLPDSALVKRMVERVKPLLKWVPGESGSALRLRKARPASLEVALPVECDKAMQRDGVEPKPPQGFGERVWWVIQMLELTPLCTWTTVWNVAPGDILAASFGGEWKKELIDAWTRAALRQRNAEWAEALFGVALEGQRFDKFEGLLRILPPPQCEARLSPLLAGDDPKTRDLLGLLVAHCRHDWSAGFSRDVLMWLRRLTAEPSNGWQVRNQLKDFARRLAPETLQEAANGWPTTLPGWDFWSKGVDEFLAAAQFRADLRAAFPHPPTDSLTHLSP